MIFLFWEGEDPLPANWQAFTVTAKPLEKVTAYGCVVPVEFTVRNGHEAAVFIDRIEATAGRRREMMAFARREMLDVTWQGDEVAYETGPKGDPNSRQRVFLHYGLLLPGQEVTFVMPWRILSGEDKLILTITPTSEKRLSGKAFLPVKDAEWHRADDDGLTAFAAKKYDTLDAAKPSWNRAVLYARPPPRPEPLLAGAIVSLPAPVAPFDPQWSRNPRDRPEAWAFSPGLGGYVVRVRAGSYNLQLEDEVIPIPPTPFEFFEALDGGAKSTRLLRHSGDVTVVTLSNARAILQKVLRTSRQISFSDDRKKAAFEEKPW